MNLRSRLSAPLFAILLGCILGPTPVGAEIFTHRDEQGITHFSNVPEDRRWFPLKVPPQSRHQARESQNQAYPFARLVGIHALQHGIDAALIRAIIKVESNFDPRARSHKGAMGLMQVLPQTAKRYGHFDLFEPNENIRVGVRHLKLLLAQFRNDLRLTLAAYNAGAGAVTKHGGVPPFRETIEYIGRVLRHYQSYRVPTETGSGAALPNSQAGNAP